MTSPSTNNSRPWAIAFAILLAGFGVILLASKMPIELWDESRQAIEGLEMFKHGWSFGTTYEYQPDLWNTKPALLIWLINASFHLFGVSTLSLRLPTTLASLGIVLLAGRFAARRAGTWRAGFVTGVVLIFSWVFCGLHCSLAADFDCLLTFFLTLAVLEFYEAIQPGETLQWNHWYLAWFGILGAVLTKSIAGCLLLPGVFIFLVLKKSLKPNVTRLPFWLAPLVVAGVVAAVYILRDQAQPGYLHAAFQNDLAQRFVSGIKQQGAGPVVPHQPLYHAPVYFYIISLAKGGFSLGPLFLLVLLMLRTKSETLKQPSLYLNLVAFLGLAVYSVAATKFSWYVVPIVPLLSILVALGFEQLLAFWKEKPVLAYGLAALLLAYPVLKTGKTLAHWTRKSDANGDVALDLRNYGNNYEDLFKLLQSRNPAHVVILDSGVYNDEGLVQYAPQLRWYMLTSSLDSVWAKSMPEVIGKPGDMVATCDPRYLDPLKSKGVSVDENRRWTIIKL